MVTLTGRSTTLCRNNTNLHMCFGQTKQSTQPDSERSQCPISIIHRIIKIRRALCQEQAIMTEMQAQIAFACYDSRATIAQGGDSMTENSMAENMAALYLGSNDPEIISYVDQFINGLQSFAGLFTSSESDEFGKIILTMPQKLHRHGGLNIFVGPTSITKELLSKKNFANNEKITGRTLPKRRRMWWQPARR